MKRWILAFVTVVAISGVGAASAFAQGYGNPHGGYSSGYGQNNHSRPRGGSSRNYGSNYGSNWHDTSHYDYHPGSVQRHGFHFHYVPGHYDYHRSGHGH